MARTVRRFRPSVGATARAGASLRARSLGFALALLVAVTAGVALAASPTVTTEFVGTFDPARLTSCRWIEGQPAANLQFEALIRQTVEAQLRSKGVRVVEGEANCAVRTRVVRSPAFPVAVLVVEALDVRNEEVVWRGEASGLTRYPIKKIEKIIVKSIKKMFKGYPRVD